MATVSVDSEITLGNRRAKIYKVTYGASETSFTITPGEGYNNPIGNYTNYSESGGTFTFTIVSSTTGKLSTIMFIS